MTTFGAKQPFVGIDKGKGPDRGCGARSDQRYVRLENERSRVSQEIVRIVVRGGSRQQIILRYAPRFALSEACRHPPVLGAVVKRGAQPGAGTSLADLNNLCCCSLIGCYGISGHPFIVSRNLCESFS